MQYENFKSFIFPLGILSLLLLFLFSYLVLKNKKKNYLFYIVLFSLLPLISFIRPGIPESGDFQVHGTWLISFYNSLHEGNIFPNWAAAMCNGFGCPVHLFAYPLPYYIASLFHFLGVSVIDSLKLLLIASYLASGIGMYFWIRLETNNEQSSFLGACFYLFSPIHLADMHILSSIGECLAYAIIPPIFIFTFLFLTKRNYIYCIFLIISVALLVLGHQPTTLLLMPLAVFYFYVTWKRFNSKNSYLAIGVVSLIFSCLLSIFYWLPALVENTYIYQSISTNYVYDVPIKNIFISPWMFGLLFQGPLGQVESPIGYAQIISIVLAVFLLCTLSSKSPYRKTLICFLLFALFYTVFLLPPMNKIIPFIPLYNNIQTTRRIILPISFIIAALSGFSINILLIQYKKTNKRLINLLFILLTAFAIATTMLNWGTRRVISTWNDKNLQQSLATRGDKNLYPIFVNINRPPQARTQDLIFLNGVGKITEHSRTSTTHSYTVEVFKNTLAQENTFFFPNWKLYIDNRQKHIDFQYPKARGIVTFEVPKGKHNILLKYEQTSLQKVSESVSILAFISIIILLITSLKLFEHTHDQWNGFELKPHKKFLGLF